jgi:UDP-3-O-[3-hydroxymyristoyl] glucosamine N-acyltransferase
VNVPFTKPMELIAIAQMVNGEVQGDGACTVMDGAPFESAGPQEITYAIKPAFLKALDSTRAAAVLVPKAIADAPRNLVVVENPYLAFTKVLQHFHPPVHPDTGVSVSAHIAGDVVMGAGVHVGPGAVVSERVVMGERVTIYPHVWIGPDVVLGNDVVVYPNVTIYGRSRIGDRVIVHAGCVIGGDGFGFAPDAQGRYHKIPHTGFVQIDDDVELGANTTIDRGTFGRTWIQRGVKIDNLVMVGHNVEVGQDSVLVSQVGISGSTTIGKNAVLAGKAGLAGHLTIGDRVTIGPKAGIGKSIGDGETILGSPGLPHRHYLRAQHVVARLPEFRDRVKKLERQMAQLLADRSGKDADSSE